jgi:hypothetical protein
MTKGITEVGSLRMPTDSRERYATRSVANRYDERWYRETDILTATTPAATEVEAFVRANAENQRRIRLPKDDDFSATLTAKAIARSANGAVQASITLTAHARRVAGVETVVNGVAEVVGAADLNLTFAAVADEVVVLVENDGAFAGDVHWVVQVDSLTWIDA